MIVLYFIDTGSEPSSLALDLAGPVSIGLENNKENLSPDNGVPATSILTPARLVQSLQEQVRVLRRAAEMLVKQSHSKESVTDASVSDKDRDNFESDVAELQEQIVKLKGKQIINLYFNFPIYLKSTGNAFFSLTLHQERTDCYLAHCSQGKQTDS